jgi:hypothetical protein
MGSSTTSDGSAVILRCGRGTYDGKKQACFRGVDQWDWEDTEECEEVEGC